MLLDYHTCFNVKKHAYGCLHLLRKMLLEHHTSKACLNVEKHVLAAEDMFLNPEEFRRDAGQSTPGKTVPFYVVQLYILLPSFTL